MNLQKYPSSTHSNLNDALVLHILPKCTNGTWSVKLWYNPNTAESCFFNNFSDVFVCVDMGDWIIRTLTDIHSHAWLQANLQV